MSLVTHIQPMIYSLSVKYKTYSIIILESTLFLFNDPFWVVNRNLFDFMFSSTTNP